MKNTADHRQAVKERERENRGTRGGWKVFTAGF